MRDSFSVAPRVILPAEHLTEWLVNTIISFRPVKYRKTPLQLMMYLVSKKTRLDWTGVKNYVT